MIKCDILGSNQYATGGYYCHKIVPEACRNVALPTANLARFILLTARLILLNRAERITFIYSFSIPGV